VRIGQSPPGQQFGRRIHARYSTLHIGSNDRIANGMKRDGQAFLTFLDEHFRLFAFCDVRRHADRDAPAIGDRTQSDRAEIPYPLASIATANAILAFGFALHEMIYDAEALPANYRFLAVNPAFERMTGLKAEAIEGHTVLEVIPGTEKRWIETYGKVALTGEPVFFENYASGFGKHFEVTAFRPRPNQFACIFADVTERKRNEQALIASESRFRDLFEKNSSVMLIIDPELGTIVDANASAANYYGYAT